MLPIAIDVMSGDGAPHERIAGLVQALRNDPQLKVLLVAQPAFLESQLADIPAVFRERIECIAASQVVAMHEHPREAIRRRKDSSMRVALDLLKLQRAAACVSAGNTGALMAMAHFVLKTIGEIERAAILSAIPSAHGHTYMLDLGANTRATARQLEQFATMGAIVARDMHGLGKPRVGLLNIGEEDIKGHGIVREAHELLSGSECNYLGFVEGDDIFSGVVDVVVTDGFTGNVALKTMEGVAGFIIERLQHEFAASVRDRCAARLAQPALQRIAAAVDPRRYNGACMVGLTAVVVKSHGRADAMAFSRAIELAALAARRDLTAHLARVFAT